MNETNALLEKFYNAFSDRDFNKMNACYHADAAFYDPAFGKLNSREVKAMWEMLLSRAGKDFQISFKVIETAKDQGLVRWRAEYLFGNKKRKVINMVEANFVFSDGLIVQHTDKFNLWTWSKQALGVQGIILGWIPFFQKSLRKTFRSALYKFMADQ